MDPGLLIGSILGLGSIAYAWYTNRRASLQLQAEAAKLRGLSEILLRGMEHAGWIKLNRDASGNIIGLLVELSGGIGGALTMTGDLAVTKIPKK